ncbi:MAG: GC-type dockerin domain-anchored protein [Phycisphaerales bacterium]|nr:GC-type dockerin domain-anchored protein [Phycisphaerales bacterium]
MVVTDDVFFSVQAPATAYINFGTGFSGHPTQSAGQYADLFAQAGGALSGPSVVNGACRSSTSGPGRKVVGLLPGNYHLNLYTFLASSSGGWQAGDFSEVTISMILAPRLPDCPADVGGIGGFAVSDGLLDKNVFIAFIGLFFSLNRQADRGSTGGDAWPDGLFDNNDFIVFIDQFFLAC